MKIVHVAAELAPIAKVGGLGDVIAGLSKEFAKLGHNVSVILPKYKLIDTNILKHFRPAYKNIPSFERRFCKNRIWQAEIEGFTLYLIDPQENDYFSRDKIYAYKDDLFRFLYFSRAALDFLNYKKEKIDILHIHDWHTASCSFMYKDYFAKTGLFIKAIVLTIHNLSYQGRCQPKDLDLYSINGKSYLEKEKLQDPKMPKRLNLLKGGIVYSNKIIAVSPTYAKEILTRKLGEHLDPILQKHKNKLTGIINGTDKSWDPFHDPYLAKKYSAHDPIKEIIKAKKINKEALFKKLNMEMTNAPLFGNVGRLVSQKGPEFLLKAIHFVEKNKGQFALLGSTFNKKITRSFQKEKNHYKNNKNISIDIEHSEEIAHLIFAASDFIVVPSLFEPCGLVQLIAFKYGAIPIVHKTGGLADTVFDIHDKTIPKEKRTGISFENYTTPALYDALKRAFDLWLLKSRQFQEIVRKNFKNRFFWKESVIKHLKLYKKLI